MTTKRVSTSFNKDQIYLMHEILTQLTRGGDPKLLVRNKAYGGLVKSVQQLRDRADNPNPPRPKTVSEPPTVRNGTAVFEAPETAAQEHAAS